MVLGTRGSDLARTQAAMVERALRAAWPEVEIGVEIIRTRGDEKSGASFQLAASPKDQVGNLGYEKLGQGRKGMFTAEIERALLDRRIDVAVHSAKDLPSEMTPGLELGAALARAAMEDVLITKAGGDLAALPEGATVATGSVRRQHQLRRVRADLKVVDLRGNVPTRLRKLLANEWSGIVLARAGLERLGFDCGSGELEFEGQALCVAVLSMADFLPAGGQGIVALQIRAEDAEARRFLAAINHAETLRCLRAEREFLRLLEGDCGTPVGVIADLRAGVLTMRAQLFEETGDPRSATAQGEEPEAVARELWESING